MAGKRSKRTVTRTGAAPASPSSPYGAHDTVRLQNQRPCSEQKMPPWICCRESSGEREMYVVGCSFWWWF